MPELGELRKVKYQVQVWLQCPDCGKERWVKRETYQPAFHLSCGCKKNHIVLAKDTT